MKIKTAGRNATPHELFLKLIRLDYPTAEKLDIERICLKIRDSIYKEIYKLNNPNISNKDIEILADFLIELNKKRDDGNLSSAEAWSIRNLENIITRMAEQQKCKEDFSYKYRDYENCELYKNVLFYVLSYIDFESINDSFDQISEIIAKCFQVDKNDLRDIHIIVSQ